MIFKTTELWPVKEFPLKAWHKFFPREYLIKYKLLIHIHLVMAEHCLGITPRWLKIWNPVKWSVLKRAKGK